MVSNKMPDPVGVILAGGASTRMGSDKAMIEVAGRPMISWVSEALGSVASRLLVSGEPRKGLLTDVEFISDDDDTTRGPLAGLASAMRQVEVDTPLIVVAVDHPWVATATLDAMISMFTGLPVVPVPDGVRQPTCAVYPANLALVALRELNSGGSVQSMLDRTSFDPFTEAAAEACHEDGRSWFSVDTPEKIETGLELFGVPGSR